MSVAFLAFVALLAVGQDVEAQSRSEQVRKTAKPARYDEGSWSLIKQRAITFVPNSVPSQVLLLKSRRQTGSGGLDQPMNDVRVLILQADRILYQKTSQFFMDEYLEIRDVTGDGIPEVLFHSGTEGASDSSTLEHILRYDDVSHSVADIAQPEFYDSGARGLRWLTLDGRTFLVIANRHWKATTPLEDRCHYCPSPFKYDILEWNNEKRAFTVHLRLTGEKDYEDASEALNGDWGLIRRLERH